MIPDQAVDILLVEDDPNDAELTLQALREHNVESKIVHVMDGDAALDFIFTSALSEDWKGASVPKVILLDLKLKKVSGLEVLRELKSERRTRTLPVVVLTSGRNEAQKLESYELGAHSYVVKPTDSRKYTQLIGEIARYWLTINEPPHC